MEEKLRFLTPTLKETVFIAILVILFIFLSYISYVRAEPFVGTYHDSQGREWPPGVIAIRYGFPLEFVKIMTHERSSSHYTGAWLFETHIMWTGLLVDLILYSLLSLFIVLAARKFAELKR